jgi:hypothetical protein
MTVPLADAQSRARTPWGDPELSGIWDYRTMTPLERPDELAGKETLTDEEAAIYERDRLQRLDKDRRVADGISAAQDVRNAYNQFWWDYGTKLTEDHRTSLIVEPRDGKIPALTPGAQKRWDARRAARMHPADGPEDRNLWERCLMGPSTGPPMNPSVYNNNVRLLQTPDYFVIFTEMIHAARIVPLGDRPGLSENVRQWSGDSRGHWEGDTLVVHTTNFTNVTSFRGSGPEMHVEERFTRVDDDTLLYEYTVDDPDSFTKPWSAAVPMAKSEGPMFEYACHEGNYAMVNLLAGARAQDETAEGATNTESK